MRLLEYGRSRDFRFETFELGTGTATQIRDFVTCVKDESGSATELGFGDVPYRSDEIMCSTADNSRLRQLGWQPSVTVPEGIRRILSAASLPSVAPVSGHS
jgi:nucleoside-diphosphate-sugar epimerase